MALQISASSFIVYQSLSYPKTKPAVLRCTDPATDAEPANDSPGSSRKPAPSGLGFGSAASASPATTSKKKQTSRRDRGSVVRRTPVEKLGLPQNTVKEDKPEDKRNENAFLLTWLGLGILILLEGILLAASGFLPDEWDELFVKYLYPSFTPTVFLFVAGTVGYGVTKYLQNEKRDDQI